jgi:predicted phosphodiesterase
MDEYRSLPRPESGESFSDYQYRITFLKDAYGIDWNDIAQLLNEYSGLSYSESTWRKPLKAVCDYRKFAEQNALCGKTRILALSDFHFPFQLEEMPYLKYKGKVDVLVLNGDLVDCQAISSFSKKYRTNFVDDLIGCRSFLMNVIDEIHPKKVIFIYGNHEDRLLNYFNEKIHEDMMELMPETALNFIVDIGFMRHDHQTKSREFFPGLKEVYEDSDIEIIYNGNWMEQYGKTVFMHPKACKSAILGTSEKAYTYLMQSGNCDFDAIVMAHTHKVGFASYGDRALIEQGCLCKEQEYATNGKLLRPQSNGYVYLVQNEDGSYNHELTRLEWVRDAH